MSAARRERPGFCIDEHNRPRSLSLCESSPSCQGSGLAASLAPRSWLEPRGSTPTEPTPLPGMLDEPVGSLPLHLERPRPQPIARHLAERQKKREALIFLLPLDRGTSSVRAKIYHKPIEPLHRPIEAMTVEAKLL